jgi:hypothetical protein
VLVGVPRHGLASVRRLDLLLGGVPDTRHHVGVRVRECGMQGAGCSVRGAGFRVRSAEYRVQGAGSRRGGVGCRV